MVPRLFLINRAQGVLRKPCLVHLTGSALLLGITTALCRFVGALFSMKHFPSFYVLLDEGNDKLNVAEENNDNNDHKTTAPR